MKKSFLAQLLEPSDGLKFREGVCLDPRITPEMLSDNNIINASEILIDINESDNLSSQNELISRALNSGWFPLEYEEKPLIKEPKSQVYNASKIKIKYRLILIGVSQLIGLGYLFLFPTTVSYLLSFTALVCLLPIYPMLLFFNKDVINIWRFLKVFRFEPNYIVELKNNLYNHFDYILSTSNEQLWIDLNNQVEPSFLADQILLMFLIIVSLIFLSISLFLQSILISQRANHS